MWRSSFLVNLQGCTLIVSITLLTAELLHMYFSTPFWAPPKLPHVLTQAPHQILKSHHQCGGGGGGRGGACFQHLWPTGVFNTCLPLVNLIFYVLRNDLQIYSLKESESIFIEIIISNEFSSIQGTNYKHPSMKPYKEWRWGRIDTWCKNCHLHS